MTEDDLDVAGIPPASSLEVGFPYPALNRLAALEAYNKHHYRPTNYQHKWWARRLGSVFRALTVSALSDPDVSSDAVWDRFAEPCEFDDAVVFDPFMGGGTTGQEATRVGAKFVGADLNPVAWFISRMALAPQPDSLEAHYREVLNRSRAEIRPYYRTRCPDCNTEAGAQFYLWVSLGTDGSGSQTVREYDTLVVDYDSNGGATVVCPACHDISRVADPEDAACSSCRHDFDATREDVRVAIDAPSAVFNGGERPAYEPYAVKYDCEVCDGSGFDAFDRFDRERLEAARERFDALEASLPLPDEPIPTGGEKTRDLHNRNYRKWTQLFTDRQLLALGSLLANIEAVDDDLARHYLTLAFSAALEFNNMFCSYKGVDPSGPGAVRHIFSHHAYVHPGEPLENNPLGTRTRQSGTFRYLYRYRLQKALDFQRHPVERVLDDDGTVKEKKPIEGERIGGDPADTVAELRSRDRTHYLHRGDSTDLPFADELAGEVDAVITDPPYYDSVQYGELADFFYVWQKRGLEADFPDAFGPDSVVSAAEAVGNATREKTLEDYRQLLQQVFETSFEVLKENGPLVFTFHHKQPAAWGAVLEAVDGAGFRVVNTYPVRGENRLSVHINGQRAVLLDSVVVCRKDREKPDGDWGTVRGRIERATRDRVRSFRDSDAEDLSRLDASVVAYGACLTEFSKFGTVVDGADTVSEREAMARLQPLVDRLNDAAFE